MATAKKCDVCDSFYDIYSLNREQKVMIKGLWVLLRVLILPVEGINIKKDLCKGCTIKMLEGVCEGLRR